MQELTQPEVIAETDLQPLPPQDPNPLPESAQPMEEADPSEVLRSAMAGNFLQHCVNNAVADKSHGRDPLSVGVANAISSLMVAIFRLSPDHFEVVLDAVARSIGEVRVDQTPVSEMLMGCWAVHMSRNGNLNATLGRMKDIADYDRHQFIAQRMATLAAGNPNPAVVEPEVTHPAPPVEADNAEEKPAEVPRKSRSRAAKKRQSGEA